MSVLLKYIDKLAADEDEQLMKLLREDYWLLLHISAFFPVWSYPVLSIFLLLYYSSVMIIHLILMIYSLYLLVLEGDIKILSLLLHYTFLLALAMFLVVYMNWVRKTMASMHRLFVVDIGIYRTGQLYSDKRCVDIKKKIRTETYYYMCVPCLLSLMGGIVILVPYASKLISGTEHLYSPKGISLSLPLPIWYPFPTHEGALHIAALMGQLAFCGAAAIIFVCCQLIFLNYSQKVKYEMRVLGYSLDTLLVRSMEHGDITNLRRYGQQNKSDTGSRVKQKKSAARGISKIENQQKGARLRVEDEKNQRIVEECIKDSIIHLQAIVTTLSKYQSATSLPMALSLCIELLVIGMSLYNILMALKVNDIGSIATFSLVLATEVLALFLASSLGASLTEESDLLRNNLYFIEWYRLDLRNRKLFLNFQTVITEPFVLKAGGITVLDMELFSSILNSAYSFFNIVNSF